MKPEQLHKFVQVVIALKKLVACVVCNNSFEDVVELECHHRCCKICLQSFQESKYGICPICTKAIRRRAKPHVDLYAEKLVELIKFITVNIQTVYSCKVENLNSINECKNVLKDITLNETNLKDEFDKLRNTNTLRTYSRKVVNVSSDTSNDVIEIQDDKVMENVRNWLSKNEKKLDFLTQTQLGEPTPKPGVSKLSLKGKLQRRKVSKVTAKQRARSLEMETRKVKKKAKLGKSLNEIDTCENYQIEDEDTDVPGTADIEKKICIGLLENDFLNSIDKNFDEESEQFFTKTAVLQCKRRKKVVNDSMNSSSWTKKLLESTSKRKPKELKVIITKNKEVLNKTIDEKSKIEEQKKKKLNQNEKNDDFEIIDMEICENSQSVSETITKITENFLTKKISNESLENNKVIPNDDGNDRRLSNSISNKSIEKNKLVQENDDSENDEDIFSRPTQKSGSLIEMHANDCNSNKLEQNIMLPQIGDSEDDDDDEIFSRPTQRNINDAPPKTIDLDGVEIVDFIRQKIEDCLQQLENQEISSKSFKIDLKGLLIYFEKLKSFVDKKKTEEIGTMTDKTIFQEIAVQTEICTKIDVGIETDKTPQDEPNIFSNSLDNVNFDTQDIVANRRQSQIKFQENKPSNNFKSQSSNNSQLSLQHKIPCSSESILVVSDVVEAKPRHLNQSFDDKLKIKMDEVRKNFKRIRPPTSQSDSDDDVGGGKAQKKFVRNDLSIHFDTNTQRQNLSEDSDNVDYDAYLEKVLKKYDEFGCSQKPPSKPSGSQQMIVVCEELIQNVSKKPKLSLSVEKPPNEDIFLSDNIFQDETNLSKINQDIEKHLNKDLVQSQCSDIISDTEPVLQCNRKTKTIVKDKFSESIFVPQETTQNSMTLFSAHDENYIKSLKLQTKTVNEKEDGKKIFDENDALDEELNQINWTLEQKKDTERIKILQNIKLNLDEHNENLSDVDAFDDDIVETTPQKQKTSCLDDRTSLSQIPIGSTPFTAELDLILPPPTGFDDDGDITFADVKPLNERSDKISVTHKMIEECSSINQISSMLKCMDEENPKTQTQLLTSTPSVKLRKSRERIMLSPINKENKRESKFSQLDVLSTKPSTSKHNIMSCTPGQKSIWNFVKTPGKSQTIEKKPCISCTRLSKDQIIAISCLSNKKLATYSTTFGPNVTHMIVSTNEKGCIKDHTIKFVFAVASGIWVLRFEWVQDSLAQNCLMPEESYEALDVSGVPGPKISRLTHTKNPLLKGYKFHCAAPFLSTTRGEVEDVIKILGGIVVESPKQLKESRDGSICIIITEAKATQDFELYENWLETFRIITVDIEWLSRSIGQYKLLSVRPFVLCCDNSICELGYPSDLIADPPLTFSEY